MMDVRECPDCEWQVDVEIRVCWDDCMDGREHSHIECLECGHVWTEEV